MTDDTRSPDETRSPKRWLLGDPLPSDKLEGQLLPKRVALPIFSSDALSSVAYAPQEMMLVLLGGGLAFLAFTPWIAAVVVILLLVVVVSYRLLIKAYPSGGGDYEVASKNLGEKAGLIVAAGLLVDYIMTVAVSVASGVDNIISAFPALNAGRVELAVGFIVVLAAINLRGVRESGKAFALPTYLFVGSIGVMVATALFRTLLGDAPVAESAHYAVHTTQNIAQAGVILLLLRAFSTGCSALTGVEAISNGVQAFRRPKIQNAQRTLVAMGSIAIVLFVSLVAVALISGVHYAENPCKELIGFDCSGGPQRSMIAQIASATFGDNLAQGGGAIMFYAVQIFTAVVLLLAANTAFNGFPLLGSVLATDRYAPKALATRGDRLIFSNGVIALGLAAALIEIVFQANVTLLIQLYIIGVFVSFTLGQTGMVRHWRRLLREGTGDMKPAQVRTYLAINTFGALMSFSVFVVVTITKFAAGAWIVFVVMPILWFLMLGVNRYYRDVDKEIEADPITRFGAKGDHAIILVGKLNKPVLKALDYAIAARHETIEAIHVSIDDAATEELERQWASHNIKIPLRVLDSPYRDISVPLIKYIKACRINNGSEVVTVYTPQFIVGHWWENLLHNHKARRIRHKLMLVHGVMLALVPWLLDSSDLIYGRRSRPLPGQDRRGEPRRPVQRRAMPPADLKAAHEAARLARSGQPMRNSTAIGSVKTATGTAAKSEQPTGAAAEKVGATASKAAARTSKPSDKG